MERVWPAEPGGVLHHQPQRDRRSRLQGHLGFALGGRYRFAPDWQWSLGFAFDSSPLSKSQRTPALPLDRQIRVGTGVQYALNERATIGAAYEYLNLGDADMDRDRGALSGRIQGDYATNEIHFFNATLSWKF